MRAKSKAVMLKRNEIMHIYGLLSDKGFEKNKSKATRGDE